MTLAQLRVCRSLRQNPFFSFGPECDCVNLQDAGKGQGVACGEGRARRYRGRAADPAVREYLSVCSHNADPSCFLRNARSCTAMVRAGHSSSCCVAGQATAVTAAGYPLPLNLRVGHTRCAASRTLSDSQRPAATGGTPNAKSVKFRPAMQYIRARACGRTFRSSPHPPRHYARLPGSSRCHRLGLGLGLLGKGGHPCQTRKSHA